MGIFRPVIEVPPDKGHDKNIDLLLNYYNLDLDYEDTYAFYRYQVQDMIAEGRYDDVLDTIIEKYKALEEKTDFVLCIGSDFEEGGSAMEFNYNADIARNLGSPVLIVTSGAGETIDEIINEVKIAREAYVDSGCQVLGIIVNRTDPEIIDDLLEALEAEMPERQRAHLRHPLARHAQQPDDARGGAAHGCACALWRGPAGQPGLSQPDHRHAHRQLPAAPARQFAADHPRRPFRCHSQRLAGSPVTELPQDRRACC